MVIRYVIDSKTARLFNDYERALSTSELRHYHSKAKTIVVGE